MDIREFSALLGVSCSTVSRAFSGRGRVSEQTRALIFEKAVEFGYRPKGYRLENNIPFARDMVVILYTLPKMDLYCDYMFTEVFCSIRETLEKSGLAASPHVIFESASTLESFYFDLF